jgi:UDP-N-acetylmuramate--alanine ligase
VDHPVVQAILPAIERRFVTYGTSAQADYQARAVEFDGPRTSFELVVRESARGRVRLQMLGEHNVRNALAALAIADELGVDPAAAREGLEAFDGVDRRFSLRGTVDQVMVVDDYGHHPEEIRVTLEGARRAYPERRIVVAFQPHRYSRTRDLLEDFAGAFHHADRLVLCPIYAAGEDEIPGVSSERLLERLHDRGHKGAVAAASVDAAVEVLAGEARPGDLVVTFGAGDITRAGPMLLDRLARRGGP